MRSQGRSESPRNAALAHLHLGRGDGVGGAAGGKKHPLFALVRPALSSSIPIADSHQRVGQVIREVPPGLKCERNILYYITFTYSIRCNLDVLRHLPCQLTLRTGLSVHCALAHRSFPAAPPSSLRQWMHRSHPQEPQLAWTFGIDVVHRSHSVRS